MTLAPPVASLDARVTLLGRLVDAVVDAATAEGWARAADVLVAALPERGPDGGLLACGLLVDRDGDRVSMGEVRRLWAPARRALGLRAVPGEVRYLRVREWDYDAGVWVQRAHWREHLDADPAWCDRPLPEDPAEVVERVRSQYLRAGARGRE